MNNDIKNDEQNNERLKAIFSRVGKEFGYKSVNAEFMEFSEIKVRWQRSYDWIDFRISDFLNDAPSKALEGLARSLFKRLGGGESEYSPELLEWITKPEFSKDKNHIYMERNTQYLNTIVGGSKNLKDSYYRLVEAGLIPDDLSVTLSWEKPNDRQKVGHCSVLMRVVAISKRLDNHKVPDYVLDYCLYHELCHIVVGYDPDGNIHDDKYFELEDRYPTKAEALDWLRTHDAYI